MTTQYTNLYAAPEGSTTYIYKGPFGGQRGIVNALYATYANTTATTAQLSGTNPQLSIAKLPTGAKITRIDILQSADADTDNDFTFNLGTTTTPALYASASTGLQGTSAVQIGNDVLLSLAAASEGDELILTRVAGELEAAATLHFYVAYLLP